MIRCCIFDLGGTLVDKYSLLPFISLSNSFRKYNIEVPDYVLAKDMGKKKLDHIQSICNDSFIKENYNSINPLDIYKEFNKIQYETMTKHMDIIPETKKCIHYLDDKSIRTGITTGFNKEQMDIAVKLLQDNDIVIENAVSSSCISNMSRPYPHMINKNMEQLRISHPKHVLKIDDTEVGIQEGINAGCYTVGVARWSINMEVFTYAEKYLLSTSNKDAQGRLEYKLDQSRKKLKDAGADFVIDTLDELPSIIDRF